MHLPRPWVDDLDPARPPPCVPPRARPRAGMAWPALALVLIGTLTGCASGPAPGASPQVPELVQQHGGPATTQWPEPGLSPQAQSEAVATLLAQPLDADAAVRLALLNSPTLQAQLAALDVSAAQRQQMALLPNPSLGLGRVREGGQTEIERLLRIDLWSLITLPWRLQWQDRQLAQARLQTAQEVLRLSAEVRRAWVRAVAAQHATTYWLQVQEAADAGAELGRQMVKAGNWSRLQQAREQSALQDARVQGARARLQAQASREQLIRLLGLNDGRALQLPAQLPAPPSELLPEADYEAQALRERLDVRAAQGEYRAIADSLGYTRVIGYVSAFELGLGYNTVTQPGSRDSKRSVEIDVPLPLFDQGQARVARSEAQMRLAQARVREVAVLARSEARGRWQDWQSAWTVSRQLESEVLPLRRQITDETLLRYNGMLSSVWELLAEARQNALSVNAAIEARRDFWLADTDLRLALSGTANTSPASSGNLLRSNAPAASAAPTPGH